MRLLHTADWHLGRQLHGHSLLDDQAHALDQIVAAAAELRPDAVIVAGDIYDRAVPPHEAVELLDEVLARLVQDLRLPTLLIAGNHDSPARLAFGARLMRGAGLVVVGQAGASPPLVLEDAHGPLDIFGLAYAEPALVRAVLGQAVHDHDAALRAQIAALGRDPGRRAVLVAHAFVAGGGESESERPLSVGGSGMVGTDAFAGFAYTALGHLHAPQSFADGRIRYSGSLLKYSLSEAAHAKSATLVEIDAAGACRTEDIVLSPRRDVRILTGLMASLLQAPRSEDYVACVIENTEALAEPFAQLRQVFPNLLMIERPFYAAGTAVQGAGAEALRREVPDLFADFFEQSVGQALSAEEAAMFAEIHDAWQKAQRESG
ncbi:exonuclease SbcCD subunit D [Marinimicrococcus flavescens]|uniref:Nuclease SbcCD subunit D n=1 Tax=Marinimicrococcus flavescens TaxID=3031815 RepID=A0AAP3UYJ6_9PROT|nr:exonuclease SbcCD subunit D [Marinimicrococcus flavescens]